MNSKLNIYASLILTALLIGCSSNEEIQPTSLTRLHPVKENIPYIDGEIISLSSDTSTMRLQLNEITNGGQSASNMLVDLDIFVSTEVEFRYVTEDKTRGIILDKGNSILYEYNIPNNKIYVLGRFGRGPGDLFSPRDVTVWDEQVFIPNVDGLLTIFECKNVSPCQYLRSINIGFVAESIAVTEDQLYVLGTPNGVLSEHPLHVLDREGNLIQSFGKIYDAESEIAKKTFSEGQVRVDPERNLIYMIFKHFPLVYVFNKNLDLVRLYQLEDFELLNVEIRLDSEGNPVANLFLTGTDYNILLGLNIEKNGELLVSVLNRSRVQPPPAPLIDSYSHYLIDNSSGEGAYLGEYDFQVLTHGEKLFLNREGKILVLDNN